MALFFAEHIHARAGLRIEREQRAVVQRDKRRLPIRRDRATAAVNAGAGFALPAGTDLMPSK